MQIVCPNCETSYQIAGFAIGADGRSVRCARCQTMWHATPPPDEAEAVAAFRSELGTELTPTKSAAALEPNPNEPPAGPSLDELISASASDKTTDRVGVTTEDGAPAALSEISIPAEDGSPAADGSAVDAAETDNGPPDIESVAARRARATAQRRRPLGRVALPVSIIVLLGLSAALIGFRKHIVAHAPQLASFYSAIGMPVNVRGLAFTDLKIGNEIHDGVPVLVVEGVIVSMVSKLSEVPRLRFALRSTTGAEIYSWTAPPPQPTLGPFETLPFRSRLASPPAEGQNVQVRFFTRHDAIAGLH